MLTPGPAPTLSMLGCCMLQADQIFALFFLVYITIIVFALIRVISAIFLKARRDLVRIDAYGSCMFMLSNPEDTLDVVQNDAEHMFSTRLKKRNEDVAKLEAVFRAIDTAGTGLITEDWHFLSRPSRHRSCSRSEAECETTSSDFRMFQREESSSAHTTLH